MHCGADVKHAQAAHLISFDPTQITSPTNRSNPQPGAPCHTLARSQAAPVIASVAPTLDASYGRLQGCSGQDARHGHGHLIAFRGNDTRGPIEVSTALNAHGGPMGRMDFESETFVAAISPAISASNPYGDHESREGLLVAHTLRADGFDVSEDGTGSGTPLVPVADKLAAHWHHSQGQKAGDNVGLMNPVSHAWGARRLTPHECERLQGYPDDYTRIPYGKKLQGAAKEELAAHFDRTGQYQREISPGKWAFDRAAFEAAWPRLAADGPRYKSVGNSMAINEMRWIGRRIQMVEACL